MYVDRGKGAITDSSELSRLPLAFSNKNEVILGYKCFQTMLRWWMSRNEELKYLLVYTGTSFRCMIRTISQFVDM